MRTHPRSLLLACMIAAAPLGARGADTAAGMAKLFDIGKSNTPPAVNAAREEALRLKRADLADLRIDYAYGVVLANQRRYDDAVRLIDRYLAAQPRDFGAQQVKIWAQMQNRKYADVLDSGAEMANQALPAPGAAPRDEDAEMARFLGMIFGYLELVRTDAVEQQQLAARKNAVLTVLGETYLPAFDEGRGTVATKLAELEGDRDARLQRAEQAAAERKAQAEAELGDNREAVSRQQESVQSSAEQMRDAQRELNVIQRQLASLERDRALIMTQVVTLQAQLTQTMPPATNLRSPRPQINSRNPATIGAFTEPGLATDPTATMSPVEIARATSISLALAGLNKQAFDVDRRMFELRSRGAELAGNGRRQVETLRESQQLASQAARQADRIEKQLDRDQALRARSSTLPGGRMRHFSTYFPLPYEREKERVSGWFAN